MKWAIVGAPEKVRLLFASILSGLRKSLTKDGCRIVNAPFLFDMNIKEIPTFYEAKQAVQNNQSNALHKFIYCEPQYRINPEWRERLQSLVIFLTNGIQNVQQSEK